MSLIMPNRNGCWSAWADPRAVHKQNKTLVGYVDSQGNVKVYLYDHNEEQEEEFVLYEGFKIDDHANPTILIRNKDNKIICFWDRSGDVYYRISKSPLNISEFGPVQTLSAVCGNYASPVQLKSENDRIYLFYRDGPNNHDRWRYHMYRYSDDGGENWSQPHNFIDFGELYGEDRRRAYTKISEEENQIHIALSSHPHHDAPHDIYYLKYNNGQFYSASEQLIGSKSDFPFVEKDIDTVWDYNNRSRKAWIFDIAANQDTPKIVFATYPDDLKPASKRIRRLASIISGLYSRYPNTPGDSDSVLTLAYKIYSRMYSQSLDHRYHYAFYNKDQDRWVTNEVTTGGGSIASDAFQEPCYSGGITLNHNNPSELYLSKGTKDGNFIIQKGETKNNGESWVFKDVANNSVLKQGRPVGVRNYHLDTEIVYWQGEYQHFNSYDTIVKSNKHILMNDIECD